jgi:hypothetical protein
MILDMFGVKLETATLAGTFLSWISKGRETILTLLSPFLNERWSPWNRPSGKKFRRSSMSLRPSSPPVLLGKPFTPEEHAVIEFYASSVLKERADSPSLQSFPIRPDL